jgi:hypothetical protein
MVGSSPCPQIVDYGEVNGSDNYSSLLRYIKNYGRKKFLSTGRPRRTLFTVLPSVIILGVIRQSIVAPIH